MWIDAIDDISTMRATLQVARQQQESTGTPTLVVFVIYNLPGRDCSARASTGELHVGDLMRYEHDFIGPIAAVAEEYAEIPKVFILEPDSLPNLVTNLGYPTCREAAADYKNGIAHAIKQLGPHGAVYIDAAWSGWIGTWDAPRLAQVIAEVLDLAGAAAKYVRGFVTNVSNYGTVASEVAYAAAVRAGLSSLGHSNLAYIIDTGRGGGPGAFGTWCNPSGAAMGPTPEAKPSSAAAGGAHNAGRLPTPWKMAAPLPRTIPCACRCT